MNDFKWLRQIFLPTCDTTEARAAGWGGAPFEDFLIITEISEICSSLPLLSDFIEPSATAPNRRRLSLF
jgi:hypothetical protein